jgi:hypothetical protein
MRNQSPRFGRSSSLESRRSPQSLHSHQHSWR